MSSGISSTPKQAGHGAPFVSFGTVFKNYFLPAKLADRMNTSTKEQEVYSVRKSDIFLTRTSETIDELGMSCVALDDYPNATFSGFVKRLRPLQDDLTYDKFMAFYLRSKYFRKCMANNAIMTLRASLNEDIFSYLELYLPDYNTQKNAGDLLYNIQAKIKVNADISAKLQSTMETLYDYWFLQFDFPNDEGKPYKSSGGSMRKNDILGYEIPDGWVDCELGDIVSRIGTGLNPRDNFKLGVGENYYVTIRNIDNGKITLDSKCDKIDDDALNIINKRSDLKAGDILFTSIQPVGITYFVAETPIDWNINESVFTLRPNYEIVTSEFLYMLLSGKEIKAFTKNSSTGSIHKGIRHGALKMYRLPYGGYELINAYSKVVSPLLQRISTLDKENRKLTEIRDSLIPVLTNGQAVVVIPNKN
jgi:type I restriction enzyme S subunit